MEFSHKPNLDKLEKIKSKVKVQRSKVKVHTIDASIKKIVSELIMSGLF
jgi:hypothetical protein